MQIKILAMDVDGTLTDGKINISSQGEIFKSFNVKDGFGIKKLFQYQIVPVIITGRVSEIAEYRCKELNITELYQGIDDKMCVINFLMEKYKCSLDNIAYIGDDINDLLCIERVGLSACPADAVKEVKALAKFISKFDGGNGAVREFIEFIISQNTKS